MRESNLYYVISSLTESVSRVGWCPVRKVMVLFSFLHHLLKVLWCYLKVLGQGAAEDKNNENNCTGDKDKGTVFLAFAATEDSTIVSRLLPVPGIRFQGHWTSKPCKWFVSAF